MKCRPGKSGEQCIVDLLPAALGILPFGLGRVLLAALLLTTCIAQVQAVDMYWWPSTAGNWSVAGNWSTTGLSYTAATSTPVDGDEVFFGWTATNAGGSIGIGDCIVDMDAQFLQLRMTAAYTGTIDFGTSMLTATGTVIDLTTGGSFTGTTGGLRINKGNQGGGMTFTPSASAALPNLTIAGTGTKNLAGNLSVSGAFTMDGGFNTGTYSITAGTVAIATGLTLTVPAGQSLTITGSGTTLSGAGNLTNNGSLILGGTAFSITGTVTANSAGTTVRYTGQADDSAVTLMNLPYATLEFDNPGTTFALGAFDLTCTNLTITGGTFNGNSRAISVSGNWTNSVGTTGFTPGTGGVSLTGASGGTQNLSGDTSFYDLSASSVSGARTLLFSGGSEQTITNALTFTGAAGSLLSLGLIAGTTQWKIRPDGSRSVTYVDVQYSNNTAATAIFPTNSVDSGNNTNWFSQTASNAPGQVTLSTPVDCPDAGAVGPDGDDIVTYGRSLDRRPMLIWNIPADADGSLLHFQVFYDITAGSTQVADSSASLVGFQYDSGSGWVNFPAGGAAEGGGQARYKPQADLPLDDDSYWTVQADDGSATGAKATVRRFIVASRGWTDVTLSPHVTQIRAVHVEELRQEIDYARALRGLNPMVWNDPTLTPGVDLIRKVHVDDLRTALQAVQDIDGGSAAIGTEAITAWQTLISAAHFQELRDALAPTYAGP